MNSIINYKKRFFSENTYLLLLALAWSPNVIGLFLRVFLGKIFGSEEAGYLIITVLILVLVIFSLNFLMKRCKLKDLLFYTVLVSVYLAYMYNSPVQLYLFEKAAFVIFQCFSMIFIGIAFKEEHFEWLHKVSFVAILTLVLYMFTLGRSTYSEEAMGHSYALLTYTCVVFIYYMYYRRNNDLILFIIGYSLILFMGSRGPFLLLNSFTLIGIIFFSKRSMKSILARLLFLSTFVILILIFFDEILNYALEISNNLGLSTRVVERMTDKSIFEDQGRKDIIETMVFALKTDLWSGLGLAGDRLFIASYSHNLFIELILSFGILWGPVLILIILVSIIRSFYFYKLSIYGVVLLILLFSSGFGKLLWSSSYLIEPHFFLMIGLIIGMMRRRHDSISSFFNNQHYV